MKTTKSTTDFTKEYKLLEIIGKGSYGKVYRGTQNKTGMVVAIKIVDMEDSDSDIEDIFKEIAFLGTISSPYITKYFESCAVDSKLWIVMEFLGGGSVYDLIKMGPLEERYCQIILRDLLRGLNYLHMQRKIHRDIKCGNILLSEFGAVKIADFGVAGQLTKTVNKRSTFIGSPFWMAPEVIKESDSGYGTAVDIWSVGITCIEMCDGKPPLFEEHPLRALFIIINNEPPTPKSTTISKQFKAFIAQCLIKEPETRADAQTLLETSFIKKAKKNHLLEPLIQKYRDMIREHGRKLSQDDDDEPKKVENEASVSNWIFETLRFVDRELIKSMANNPANATDKIFSKTASNEKSDIEEPISSKGIHQTQCFLNIFEQLLVKHPNCAREIDQMEQLAKNRQLTPFSDELTKLITEHLPCKK